MFIHQKILNRELDRFMHPSPNAMRTSLLLLLLLLPMVINATYNSRCMELVSRESSQSEAHLLARGEWEATIRNVWGIRRTLSNVDFEALMDLTHGLDITVVFNNGVRATEVLRTHSVQVFQNLIRRHEALEVEYSAESNQRMSKILAAACRLLRKPNCLAYEHFSGLKADPELPFSFAQEQALKWATIHIAPAPDMAQAYSAIPAPFYFVERFNSRIVDQKQLLSLYILMSAFGEEEGALLHVGLAQDFIDSAYQRLIQVHRSGIFY